MNWSFSTRISIIAVVILSATLTHAQDDGFKPIFDGKTMKGWKGDAEYWRVEGGIIVGETTPDKPKLKVNNFLAWADGEVDDFELKLKFRISGTKSANSGVQYRGSRLENGRFLGYQADIDKTGRYI